MTGETRILGSFISVDLSSVNEVTAAIDSTRYTPVAAYVTNIVPGITAAEHGNHYEIWTGPGGTGTKLAGDTIPQQPSPPSPSDIRQLLLLVAPVPIGKVLTADPLYWRTTVPKGSGITADVHIVGFDVP